VQETWAAAVAGIRRIQDVVAFPRWMFRIVGNKAADRLRRATRQRRLTERLEADAEYCAVSPPQHDAIHDAFARLPRDQRALLSLHYVEGFTTAEIAEILGVPQGTVKSRLYHARRALRQIMGLENDD